MYKAMVGEVRRDQAVEGQGGMRVHEGEVGRTGSSPFCSIW